MRKLALKDAFSAARIMKKADIKTEIVKFSDQIMSRKKKETKVEEIGLEFVVTMIASVSDKTIEDEIYDLLADITGMSADEVKNSDFTAVKKIISDIVNENDLKSFFRSVSASM